MFDIIKMLLGVTPRRSPTWRDRAKADGSYYKEGRANSPEIKAACAELSVMMMNRKIERARRRMEKRQAA